MITVKEIRDILEHLPDDMNLTTISSFDSMTRVQFIDVRVNLEAVSYFKNKNLQKTSNDHI